MQEIYLDNSATTRISEEALAAYVRVSREVYGNPSSLHAMGLAAERELTAAREAVRASLGQKKATVIFTASGTEANNLAILGRAYAKARYRAHAKIITTAGEHASVGNPVEALRGDGFTVAYLPTAGGEIDEAALRRELTPDTILVSVMMVNNETGALYDVAAVARIVHELCPDALFHIDATQSYLKVPMHMASLGADLITLSSHKIEGPKGVGALVVAEHVIREHGIAPRILGGGQEDGLRSGTENVPGIAAFGEAVRLGTAHLGERMEKLNTLRTYLIEKLHTDPALSAVKVTDPPSHAPHIVSLILPSIRSETMLHYLSSLGIYVSSGSACSSHSHHESTALLAYGIPPKEADCTIRVSLSYRNECSDMDALLDGLRSGITRLARTVR